MPHWSAAPYDVTPAQRKNFINVQIDAVGVGLANASSPFLPVFLTRLGASNMQVGLLTSMPGFTGLVIALLVGRFLQTRRNVVPWFSLSRLLLISAYAATGLAAFFVPREYLIPTILIIWAAATLPQITVNVAFSVVMNAVAGPHHRYELMSRRWSILGLTSAISVSAVGLLLDQIDFPLNYQVVFMGLSIGGLISYYFSSHINLPDTPRPEQQARRSLRQSMSEYFRLVLRNQAFVRISIKRFVFQAGMLMATPIFPLYFVREVHASDAWIGLINTSKTFVLVIGYILWANQSRLRGSRFVLLCATLGMTLYPMLVGFTHRVELIVVYAGLAGVFQAGIDLVFFDELMKTVPPAYSATFVSVAHSLQYLAAIISPLAGTALANYIGLGNALLFSAFIHLVGFLLFALWHPEEAELAATTTPEKSSSEAEPAK